MPCNHTGSPQPQNGPLSTRGRLCAVVDLKSANKAAPSALPAVVNERKYHIQDAWYLRGIRALGLGDETTRFLFVFCEKEPPHLVTVGEIAAEDLDYADRRCDRACEILRDCEAVDLWPGYPPGIHQIRLPPWAKRDDEDEDRW